ncbi:hypothetical protein [uncultured Cellulomonas sp.]|uniref:hypothetical protein n=1 Tax=uncultured Cellulomonas sp. TaxID=189682 RepID=UPI00261C37F8|nr:hypothetical protein [uncultured Cellulomonas sp.]
MGATVSIATPLGPLRAGIDVAGATRQDPSRQSTMATGAQVLVWADVGGLVVDALTSRVAPFAGATLDLPETQMWGIEWRLYAARKTTDITVFALLPDDVASGSIGGDEGLVTSEFATADWSLAIGGPDE